MNESNVFVYHSDDIIYQKIPPFHPSNSFPEYPFKEISENKNLVYKSFRELLYLMGLDKQNFNTSIWNPFKKIISPGDTVLIKPNLVINDYFNQDCLISHPSLIRAVIDYVIIALNGKGEIIIGDAPLQQCNFKKMNKETGLINILNFYKKEDKGIKIHLIDFRKEKMFSKLSILTKNIRNLKKELLRGDPKGYKIINLREQSNLQSISLNKNYKKFRVPNYDPNIMFKTHNDIDHKYLIPNSVISADVIINIPKIKAHRKAGITACLKNSIGINGHKDWLPHHRVGSISEGGDEYPYRNKLKKMIRKIIDREDYWLINKNKLYISLRIPLFVLKGIIYYLLKILNMNLYFEGSWYGNDTLWRTIADLNQILLYTDKKGNFTFKRQRKRLYFCDGIIGGEKEGPLYPSPKKMGLLIGGLDPVIVDLAITELLNFDYRKIPQIKNLFKLENRKITEYQPTDLNIFSNQKYWNEKTLNQVSKKIYFQPSRGWENFIEKTLN